MGKIHDLANSIDQVIYKAIYYNNSAKLAIVNHNCNLGGKSFGGLSLGYCGIIRSSKCNSTMKETSSVVV